MQPAPARGRPGFDTILCATDFSDASAHAIPYVASLAKHYQSHLIGLHVRPPVVNPMTQPATWPAYVQAAKVQDEQLRHDLLAAFEGIPAETIIAVTSLYLSREHRNRKK